MMEEEKEEKILTSQDDFLESLQFLKSKFSLSLPKIINLSWRPPQEYRNMSLKEAYKIRVENNILAEGEDLMAPIKSFKV